MDSEKIGQFIRTLRKENHLTQDELADKLFITRENISKWERGVTIPNITYLKELCKIFNITIDEILSAKRNIPKETKNNNKTTILLISIIIIETIIILILLIK